VTRLGMVLIAIVFAATLAASSGGKAHATTYTASGAVKINVMGEWAHPDDDTSIVGPCGVWHDKFGVRCGIIMITRGEGGGNAVGTEIGPALGLRRENEDRSAHFRSGTVDIFNIDKVDFFFNQSAPETQFFWGHDDTLRRVTRGGADPSPPGFAAGQLDRPVGDLPAVHIQRSYDLHRDLLELHGPDDPRALTRLCRGGPTTCHLCQGGARFECVEDDASELAFEAADGFASGLAFAAFAFEIRAGGWVVARLRDRDPVRASR
jgi:hypothetical protein